MSLKWFGSDVEEKIHSGIVKNLIRACYVWTTHAKNKLSVAGRGLPSPEGDYPHKQKGHLRRNVTHEIDPYQLIGRVGTNVVYGKHLEIGTSTMRPRPWMNKTTQETMAAVTKELGRKV